MKYSVEIKEQLGIESFVVWEVEAKNEEEAKTKALNGDGDMVDSYDSDNCWPIGSSEVTDVTMLNEND